MPKKSARDILGETFGKMITVRIADMAMNKKSETFQTLCQIPAASFPKLEATVRRITVSTTGVRAMGTSPIRA